MTESARMDLFGQNIFPFTVLSNPNFPTFSRIPSYMFLLFGQVGFCEGVCLPVYTALSSLSPALSPLLEATQYNRDRRIELADNNQEEAVEEDDTVNRKGSVGEGRMI